MKYVKSSLILLLMAALFNACSVSNESRSMQKTINGDWILQTITTEGITGVTRTRIFNEADFNCFIGSEWNFINNNGMGSYTIVDKSNNCVPLKRLIRWTIYEPADAAKEFQFKRLDDKKNAMDNGDGYRLTVTELDKTIMKLRSNIVFDGHAGAVIYNFVKK
ncbi:MAG: lipocalin family protein [Chitinophagaceae bacterium]|nr:lipocalin family protein [Chitinophagaceae bacterium]